MQSRQGWSGLKRSTLAKVTGFGVGWPVNDRQVGNFWQLPLPSLPPSVTLCEMYACPENLKIYIHNLMLFRYQIKSTK